MLVVGIVVVLIGISDLVIAGVVARQRAGSSGLGGTGGPTPVERILKVSGVITVLAGAVLVAIGLAG